MGVRVKKLSTYDLVSSPSFRGASFHTTKVIEDYVLEDYVLKFYGKYYFKGDTNLVKDFGVGLLPYKIKLLSYMIMSESVKKVRNDGVKLEILFLMDSRYMVDLYKMDMYDCLKGLGIDVNIMRNFIKGNDFTIEFASYDSCPRMQSDIVISDLYNDNTINLLDKFGYMFKYKRKDGSNLVKLISFYDIESKLCQFHNFYDCHYDLVVISSDRYKRDIREYKLRRILNEE